MKLVNLRYLPKVIGRREWFFAIGFLIGIPLCLILWHFDPIKKIGMGEIITSLIGGIITIALILSSIVGYFERKFKEKKYLIQLIYPLSLIIVAVFFAIWSYLVRQIFYFALYYLLLGTTLFLNEIRAIVTEETIGATLWEMATYESREKKTPYLGDKSSMSDKVFEGKIRVCKGDTILVVCEFLQDGRTLAKKIINNAEYAIYVSSDRPYTVVEEEFKAYNGKLYCIDCFTNLYGLGEFKQAEKGSNSYTLNPPTIKEFHNKLREIRRRIVSQILCGKDWVQLDKVEKKEIERELTSREDIAERSKNVWIVYDSISSLAAVFDIEPLMMFLIHDTTVDMTIGRNTLLLVKNGAINPTTASRLESLCEHILNAKVRDSKIYLDVCGSVDINSSKNFWISI